MSRKTCTCIVFVFLLLISIHSYAAISQNELHLSATKSSDGILTLNAKASINIPSGDGFVYVVLPFTRNSDIQVKILPRYENEVLTGHTVAASNYLIVQIMMQAQPTVLNMEIGNICVGYNKSASQENTAFFLLEFKKSVDEFISIYSVNSFILFDKVTIDGVSITQSDPPFDLNTPLKTIDLASLGGLYDPVIYFVENSKQLDLVFTIFISLVTIPLGVLGVTQIKKKHRPKWIVGLTLALITEAILLFVYILPLQKYKDMGALNLYCIGTGLTIVPLIIMLIGLIPKKRPTSASGLTVTASDSE